MPCAGPPDLRLLNDSEPAVYTAGLGCNSPPGLKCAISKLTLRVTRYVQLPNFCVGLFLGDPTGFKTELSVNS